MVPPVREDDADSSIFATGTWGFARAIQMVPRNPVRIFYGVRQLERQYGYFVEGMPVFMAADDADPNEVWWVVSRGGYWHYGSSVGERDFHDLARDGFFEMRGPDAERWIQSSKPHGGKSPDRVGWKGGQGVAMRAVRADG